MFRFALKTLQIQHFSLKKVGSGFEWMLRKLADSLIWVGRTGSGGNSIHCGQNLDEEMNRLVPVILGQSGDTQKWSRVQIPSVNMLAWVHDAVWGCRSKHICHTQPCHTGYNGVAPPPPPPPPPANCPQVCLQEISWESSQVLRELDCFTSQIFHCLSQT